MSKKSNFKKKDLTEFAVERIKKGAAIVKMIFLFKITDGFIWSVHGIITGIMIRKEQML